MAKKKDITRNPPSWLEKSIFGIIILLAVAIAFPICWKLNQTTIELYTCYGKWSPILDCVEEWREQTNPGKFENITREELLRRYREKIGDENAEFPNCPYDETKQLVNGRDGKVSSVGCSTHSYDLSFED